MTAADRFVPDPRPLWAREAASLDAAACVRAFGDTDAYTVGVEEELMLVDPATHALAPVVETVFPRLAGDPRFAKELRASMIESITPVCASAADAETHLASARAALVGTVKDVAALIAAGTHPDSSDAGALTPGDRYRAIAAEYPWPSKGLMCGLHVHIALGDAARALSVFNAIRSFAPELSALAANAPFYRGEDSGLASVRPILNEAFPRAGVPPSLRSWQEFVEFLDWGRRGGSFPDATFLWWDIRPHPLLGTIELRLPDAATRVADAAAIAAVAQALAAWLGARHDGGDHVPVHDSFRIGENSWSALRHGIGGWLLDLDTGEPEPTRDRLLRLLDGIEPYGRALGVETQLLHARTLVADNGAERQRYVHAREGMRGLLRWLVAETSGGEQAPELA